MSGEGQSVQVTKCNLKLLARENEDETVVLVPDTVGVVIARVEPQAIGKVPHAEQVEIAVRVGNRLHTNDQPLVLGLVLVLQTQLGTDLVRAELETAFLGGGVDVPERGSLGETELGDTDDDQVDVRLLGGHAERGLTDDVIGPVADPHATILDGFAEAIGVLDARAESDPLPDLGVGGNLGQHREHLLQALGVFNPPLHLGR